MAAARTFSKAELEIVREMRVEGHGITPIARRLKCGREAVYRLLAELGEDRNIPRLGREPPRDPMTDLPIGKLPPTHPLWIIDQQILRSKENPEPPSPWRGGSSLSHADE